MPGIPGYAGAPEPDAHDADAPHTRGEPEDAPDFTAVSNADTGDEPSRDHRLNGQPSDGENGLNPDETGGRRRRRRGRRGGRGGRGRRGGSGGAPADPAHADDRPADAPAFDDNLEVPADGAPADSEQGVGAEGDRRSRGGRRRRGKRGGRGGRGNGANPENTGREPDGRSKFSAPPPREAARPAAPPTPAPAPKSDQQPKRPRSLYATRRRLGPGEIKGIGGGDE
jgi:ribonuclease E